MDDTSAALRAAEELVEALKKHPKASHAEHLALLAGVDKVRDRLETPYDVIEKQQEVMSTAGAMYTLIMTGAIKKVPDEGTITAEKLAARLPNSSCRSGGTTHAPIAFAPKPAAR